MPTVQDILLDINEATVFSHLDLNAGIRRREILRHFIHMKEIRGTNDFPLEYCMNLIVQLERLSQELREQETFQMKL